MKKITVFTSSHNHSKYLRKSIESVLNQTYVNIEYLLFDDGSSDNSYDIMMEYSGDERVTVIKLSKQSNVGVVINKSIKMASGDYWSWCPADDYWDVNLLQKKLEYTSKYPNSVLYNDWSYINEMGNIYGYKDWGVITSEEFKRDIWKSVGIGFTGIMIPMTIFRDMNLYFPEHLKYSEDFYWMIKAVVHDIPFDLVPHRLHFKRRHPNSLSTKNSAAIVNNIPNIRRELQEYEKKLKK